MLDGSSTYPVPQNFHPSLGLLLSLLTCILSLQDYKEFFQLQSSFKQLFYPCYANLAPMEQQLCHWAGAGESIFWEQLVFIPSALLPSQ